MAADLQQDGPNPTAPEISNMEDVGIKSEQDTAMMDAVVCNSKLSVHLASVF